MTQEAPIIRILKIGACPTLSGSGKLEYHIGLEGESEILFRMTSNSGGGYFSGSWVPLKVIQNAIDKAPEPLTSFALSMLFRGKSVNTSSFLWSCLLSEGLIKRDEQNPRSYIAVSPDAFMSEMTKLIDAGTDLKVPLKVTGKGVVKSSGKDDVVTPPPPSKDRPKKPKSGS